jgi:hypothetical protein
MHNFVLRGINPTHDHARDMEQLRGNGVYCGMDISYIFVSYRNGGKSDVLPMVAVTLA